MCDFNGPPYRFKLYTFVPTQEELSWKPGRAWERVTGNTIFEHTPFRGNISYTGMDAGEATESGLYFVCCTGSHYEYYDAMVEKWYEIKRLDGGDPALRCGCGFHAGPSNPSCQKEEEGL